MIEHKTKEVKFAYIWYTSSKNGKTNINNINSVMIIIIKIKFL